MWKKSASGNPDEVRHQARRWSAGHTGLEAAQIEAANGVVDRITKEFVDITRFELRPGTKEVVEIVDRASISVSASGEVDASGSGSVTVSFSVTPP